MKIKVNSKKIPEAIAFISSMANIYSSTLGNTGSDKVLLQTEGTDKLNCIYARQGVYIKVIIPEVVVEEEGFLVAEAKYFQSLRTVDEVSSITTTDEVSGSYFMMYKNGRSIVKLLVDNDKDEFNNNAYDGVEIPTNVVELDSNVSKAIKHAIFNSHDAKVDKKLGLTVNIRTKGDFLLVQTNDKYSAVAEYLPRPDENVNIDIYMSSMLIDTLCKFAGDDGKVSIAHSDDVMLVQNEKFYVLVPPFNNKVRDIDAFIETLGTCNNSVTIAREDCNLSSEVSYITIVSRLANNRSIIELEIKEDSKEPGTWRVFFGDSSSLGNSRFRAVALSHDKPGKYRFNADDLVQMLPKVGNDSNTVIEFYEQAIVISDEARTIQAVVGYV